MVTVEERDGWLTSGWKRGAFIKVEEQSCLFDKLPSLAQEIVLQGQDVYLVPVLNDCALVNQCFITEPWVHALVCWSCNEKKDDLLFAKNPRKYQFPVIVDEKEFYLEALATNVLTLDREEFLRLTPSKKIAWPKFGLDRILNWVAERFVTPTFPDSWNKRLKTREKNLKKVWKLDSFSKCSGVYFRIEPFDELPEDKEYKLWVYFCLPAEMSTAEYRKFNSTDTPILRERLKAALSPIKNLSIESIDSISEESFTKKNERQYKRWILEYYSYSSPDEPEIPAEFVI